MDYYINIQVLPDPEFEATTLMNALYAKSHRVIGQLGGGEVGVSFPKHKKTLGDTLRLHGSDVQLQSIMAKPWLKGLRDYTQVSSILCVEEGIKYRTVYRVIKKSAHNKRKRSVAKGWLSTDEAEQKINDDDSHIINLPFAQLTSLSNKNPYKVFIKHGEIVGHATSGTFNSYGLSKVATIPWF